MFQSLDFFFLSCVFLAAESQTGKTINLCVFIISNGVASFTDPCVFPTVDVTVFPGIDVTSGARHC